MISTERHRADTLWRSGGRLRAAVQAVAATEDLVLTSSLTCQPSSTKACIADFTAMKPDLCLALQSEWWIVAKECFGRETPHAASSA